jgi:hypothetical protein
MEFYLYLQYFKKSSNSIDSNARATPDEFKGDGLGQKGNQDPFLSISRSHFKNRFTSS